MKLRSGVEKTLQKNNLLGLLKEKWYLCCLIHHQQRDEISLSTRDGSAFLNCNVYSNLNLSCCRYPAVHCRTKNEDFSLNLGLLDFGAVYLFVITNVSSPWLSSLFPSIYLYLYNYIIPKLIYNLYLYVYVSIYIYISWIHRRLCGKMVSHTYLQCKVIASIVTLEKLLRSPERT